jgi:mannose-6-phosphate isomerase-like protein (cupin superfamily)
MEGFRLKRIDELASIHHGVVRLAADELGVQSFGLQVLDLPADFTDYPEHDHSHDGQEEVYVVLDGSAAFDVAGERVYADSGSMLWIGSDTRRRIEAGEQGVRILAIGCAPGGGYERPEDFRLAARA